VSAIGRLSKHEEDGVAAEQAEENGAKSFRFDSLARYQNSLDRHVPGTSFL